jgi:hypothetical protein
MVQSMPMVCQDAWLTACMLLMFSHQHTCVCIGSFLYSASSVCLLFSSEPGLVVDIVKVAAAAATRVAAAVAPHSRAGRCLVASTKDL